MRKNILNSVFLIAAITLIIGCKPKKIIVTPPPTAAKVEVKDDKQDNLNLLKSKDFVFNTLSLKGKTTLKINGGDNDVTMNIRIQKDEKIWVSVTGIAGIEGARALITPDSLLLRNNLQKTFLKKPFSYIYSFTNKEVNFALLQSILSGNTIAEFMTAKSNFAQENENWIVSGSNGDLVFRNVFNTLYKIAENTLSDPKAGQSLKVTYGDYTQINNGLFPSSFDLTSKANGKTISVSINFSKIDVNVPLQFPFTVPKNYEVIK